VGISREGDIIDLASDFEIIKQQGAFYSYGDQKMGQGREQAKDYLRENPDLAKELESLIVARVDSPQPMPVHAGAEPE
jgi:recombination protein RecA